MRHLHVTAGVSLLWVLLLGALAGIDGFFLVCFLGVAVLSVTKIIHQKDYHTKGRQIIHLVAGITLVYSIKIFGMGFGMLLSILGLAAGILASEIVVRKIKVPVLTHAVEKFERKDIRPLKGLVYYALGAFLTMVLFFNSPNSVFAGILAIAFVDSFATGFGTMFGKVEFINGRSVEGILAGFFGCYFVCATFLPAPAAFTAAIVGTAVDVANLKVDDNLTIPLIVAATVVI